MVIGELLDELAASDWLAAVSLSAGPLSAIGALNAGDAASNR